MFVLANGVFSRCCRNVADNTENMFLRYHLKNEPHRIHRIGRRVCWVGTEAASATASSAAAVFLIRRIHWLG